MTSLDSAGTWRSLVAPEALFGYVGQFRQVVVVRREGGILLLTRGPRGEGLGPHTLFVLEASLLLLLGHFSHVQQRVPTEHAQHGDDGPLDGVEKAQRVALNRAAELPPRRRRREHHPKDDGQVQGDCSRREILGAHWPILLSRFSP